MTLLPPHVAHDGRPATTSGFVKRVLYLDAGSLPETLIGAAVDAPMITDRPLRDQVSRLDQALSRGDDLEAESRLALVVERLGWHLKGRPVSPEPASAVRSPVLPASRAGIRLQQVSDLPDPEQHQMSPRTRRAAQH